MFRLLYPFVATVVFSVLPIHLSLSPVSTWCLPVVLVAFWFSCFLYLVFWFSVFDPCLPELCLWIFPCAFAQFGLFLWFYDLCLALDSVFACWTAYLVFWISASVFGLRPLPTTSLNVCFTPTLNLRLVLRP